jgi:beta-glucoside operon transcriptional antiterminator
LDGQNHELIAMGKGIGFPEMPYEIKDLSVIDRTFYNVDTMYVGLAKDIPEDILNATIEVVDMIRMKVDENISSNLVFTLADHVRFAVQRRENGMIIAAPMRYDIENLYTDEYDAGVDALRIYNKHLKVRLPIEEASNLALHIINAENISATALDTNEDDDTISAITDIIAGYFELYIDKHSFNYSRFVTHMQYLIKRQIKGEPTRSNNQKLYQNAKESYPKVSDCVDKIADFLQETRNMELEDEEKLYLMMHVNRLCSQEGL